MPVGAYRLISAQKEAEFTRTYLSFFLVAFLSSFFMV